MSFNMMGINHQNIFYQLNCLKRKKQHIYLIQETQLRLSATADKIRFSWGQISPKGHCFISDQFNGSCGTMILVTGDCPITHLTELSISSALIGRYQLLQGQLNGRFIYIHNIYAPVIQSQQPAFYSSLPRISSPLQIAGGDFNNVICPSMDDISISGQSVLSLDAFELWRFDLDLQDSFRFLFPDKQAFTHAHRRLDMIFASPGLINSLSSANIDKSMDRGDHHAVLASFHKNWVKRKPTVWRPIPRIVYHPKISSSIESHLQSFLDDPIISFQDTVDRFEVLKLSLLKMIKREQYLITAKDSSKLRRLKLVVDHAKLAFRTHPSAVYKALLHRATDNLVAFQDLLHKQRTQGGFIRAINKSEKPSKMFLRQVGSNHSRKPINASRNALGDITMDPQEILSIHSAFWYDIFNPEPDIDFAKQDDLIHDIFQRIPDLMVDIMDTLPTESEIENVIKHLNSDSSPGFDGLTNEVYKTSPSLWAKVLHQVYVACFHCKSLTPSQRRAIIPIMYKKGDPLDPANFRPISLLNCDAKIFTKCITVKLRPIMDIIVDDQQTGFMPHRSIHHNIIRMLDLIQYNLNAGQEAAIMFLDFKKAYDKVNWDFLFRILRRLGFGDSFIAQIRMIYSNRQFAISINGAKSGWMDASSGVIQGDPLSCFLFAIYLIPLMNLMSKHKSKGINIDGVMEIASYFADDTSIFSQDTAMAIVLFNIIERDFCAGSGAVLHPGKTVIMPLSLSPSSPHPVFSILQPHETIRVLGIQMGVNAILNNHVSSFAPEFDKVCSRFGLWKNRGRTLIGRVHLVRSLFLSCFMYKSAVIPIGSSSISKLQRAFNRFITKSIADDDPYSSKRKMSGVNSNWISIPTLEGGLGLFPFKHMIEVQRLSRMIDMVQALSSGVVPTYLRPSIAVWKQAQHSWCVNPVDLLYVKGLSKSRLFSTTKSKLPLWWQENLMLFIKILHPVSTDVGNMPIWSNRLILFRQKTIIEKMISIDEIHTCRLLLFLGFNQVKDFLSYSALRWKFCSELIPEIRHRYDFLGLPAAGFQSFCFVKVLSRILRSLATLPLSVPLSGNCWYFVNKDNISIPIMQAKRLDLRKMVFQPTFPANLEYVPLGVSFHLFTPETWKFNKLHAKYSLPMHHDVLWRLQHNSLITGHRLQFLPFLSHLCPMGCPVLETPYHLFWECPFAHALWIHFLPLWFHLWPLSLSWQHILDPSSIPPSPHKKLHKTALLIFGILRSCVLHRLWFNRNAIVFRAPERTLNIVQLYHHISGSFQLHWVTICRIGPPSLKQQVRRLKKFLDSGPSHAFSHLLNDSR